MSRGRHDEVDLDSLMASVHRQGPAPAKPQQPARPLQQPAVRTANPTAPVRETSPHKQKGRSVPKKLIISSVIVLAVMVGAVGVGVWAVPNLLAIKSPFSQELKDKMDAPLYYPTKLPGTFKIETNSITQPEADVIIYAITDDAGKRINITLQKQPAGINLDPLYAVLTDVKEFDSKNFGKVKYGLSAEKVQVANILTGQTWIIINYPDGTIDQPQLATIVNSLKQ